MVSNPFKVGDKVVEAMYEMIDMHRIGVATVAAIERGFVQLDTPSRNEYHAGGTRWHHSNLRAAIAGVDYPATKRDDNLPLQPSGHLSDGGSVQKHSAGGLYPVVIWHRDKTLPGAGKYDVGLTWPDQAEPVWFRDYDSASNVAEAIKESLK